MQTSSNTCSQSNNTHKHRKGHIQPYLCFAIETIVTLETIIMIITLETIIMIITLETIMTLITIITSVTITPTAAIHLKNLRTS